jgi:hypothetical protein
MINDTGKFLGALFGGIDDIDIPFELDGARVLTNDPAFIAENEGRLRVSPADPDSVFFLFAAEPETHKGEWEDCRREPTVVLWKDGTSIYCWGFKAAVQLDQTVMDLVEYFDMESIEECIPLPGTDGWELIHANYKARYYLAELTETYLDPVTVMPPAEADSDESEQEEDDVAAPVEEGPEAVAMYGEAKVITPYDESMYDGKQIVVSLGSNQFSKNWVPQKLPLTGLIHQFTKHEIGKKDGVAVVFADMVKGQRVKKSIKTCTAIGLDIDTGTPSAVVDKAIAELGCLAIRATTHSHGKTSSEINKDKLLKFRPETEEIDTELCQAFLRDKEQWDESIVKTVKFVEEDHTEKGIVARVSHKPMPKHRVILPLENEYVIADEGRTQIEAMAKWAKVPAALAARVGVPFDRSCTDPSRLFYTPRHDKGKPYEISLFGGPLFQLSNLQLDNVFDAVAAEFAKGGGSKSVTLEGRNLGKWWVKTAHGFQIMDVIEEYCPDRKRSKATYGYNIECPFDEDHSNAGDASDGACYAVNAADGPNEFFVVKCQHEGCKDKTANDMLGKMIKDEWFDREVIDDPNFNIAQDDDAPEPPKSTDTTSTFHDLCTKIDELKDGCTGDDVSSILSRISNLSDEINVDLLLQRLKKVTGIDKKLAKSRVKSNRKAGAGGTNDAAHTNYNGKGVLFHHHVGPLDADEAIQLLKLQLKGMNEAAPQYGRKERSPRFTAQLDSMYQLRTSSNEPRFVSIDQASFRAITPELMFTCKALMSGAPGASKMVPADISSAVHKVAYSFLPPTPELIRTPLVAPDASIISRNGWHTSDTGNPDDWQTNFYLAMGDLQVPDVPDSPNIADVENAKTTMTDLVKEIHFCDIGDDGGISSDASRTNAIGMIMTPFLRPYIGGISPLFVIEKPVPGAGATLLSFVPQLLYMGKFGTPASYTKNEEEMQKQLVTKIIENEPIMCFDNIEEFSSRTLKQALTSPVIGGRILGLSEQVSRTNNFLFIATGINPLIFADMVRRVCRIRLDPQVEDIQTLQYERDLLEWIPKNRGRIIWAILVLFKAWHKKGAVQFTGKPLSSFEKWSSVIGGVLEFAGLPGFLANPRKPTFGSRDTDYRTFAKEWFARNGLALLSLEDTYRWAGTCSLECFSGRDGTQNKSTIRGFINEINGRTFDVDGDSVSARLSADNESVTFGFVSVDR